MKLFYYDRLSKETQSRAADEHVDPATLDEALTDYDLTDDTSTTITRRFGVSRELLRTAVAESGLV
jgi:hypothetical protein